MGLPDSLSNCTMCVQLSTDGTSWTDFSDDLSVLTPPSLARQTGEAYVFGEDVAVTAVGKIQPFEITLRGVYEDSTATSNAFAFCWAAWTTSCGGALAVRWAPAGCATTNQVFSTATATGHKSECVGLTPPGGDAGDAGPIMFEVVVRAPELWRATYAA